MDISINYKFLIVMNALVIIGIVFALLCLFAIISKVSSSNKENSLPSLMNEKGLSEQSEIYKDGLMKKHYVVIDKINKKLWCAVLSNRGVKSEKMFDNFCATGNAILVDENDDAVRGIVTDSVNKKLVIVEMMLGFLRTKEIDYNKIVSVELLQNNARIESVSNSSMIGRGIVGGLVAGEAGAIIGGATAKTTTVEACTSLSLKILLNDENEPNYVVDFYQGKPIKNIDVLPLGIVAEKAKDIITLIIQNNK